MKALSQLVELFEKDSSFLKEWRREAVSAVNDRGLMTGGAEKTRLQKIVLDLKHKKHLSRQPALFGM